MCLAGQANDGSARMRVSASDERVGPGVGSGQAEPELAGVVDDPGGDVGEREPQSFPAAATDLAW